TATVSIPSTDPDQGIFRFPVTVTMGPDIALTDPQGAKIAPGGNLPVGVRLAPPIDPVRIATVTVTNNGHLPLSLAFREAMGAEAAMGVPVPCDLHPPWGSEPLAPGATATLEIDFVAQSEGYYNASVVIPSDDPDHPLFTFQAIGAAAPRVLDWTEAP